MRKFRTVYMRGGTSKGCLFRREDLPADQKEWDSIFLQVMGDPDPKQIDGMGGTVSSNNKIVVVWKSEEENVDIEYLVAQVIVGRSCVDYKSNCGNMTAAVPAYAVEEGMVAIHEPFTMVHMLNRNTDQYIDAAVPIDPVTHTFSQNGECSIAGVDGTAAELRIDFLRPSGSKTGKLFPTGQAMDLLEIPGHGTVEATILDVSNPLVLVRAASVGLKGTELYEDVDADKNTSEILEKIRGAAACRMGFAKDLRDASENSPAIPKICLFTAPSEYDDVEGSRIPKEKMDLCVRVISFFKCHRACPLTSACAIAAAARLDGTIVQKTLGTGYEGVQTVRIGHPSGVMALTPTVIKKDGDSVDISAVSVVRTARRIMDGMLYIRK